ncbi:MAG: hypothetical protein LPK26_18615 [Bacillaceae bacterium]|nr:hypothetical protein [Bacillaceae bacterium]
MTLILVCNGAGGHGGTINPVAFVAEVKQFWNGITILAGGVGAIKNVQPIAEVIREMKEEYQQAVQMVTSNSSISKV